MIGQTGEANEATEQLSENHVNLVDAAQSVSIA
jgi:hypothetical protein